MLAFPRLLTAMASPMTPDRTLDLDGAQRLAVHLVDHGNDGIVVAGTTGESPTLDRRETLDLFRAVVEAVGERACVLAGCGKNDTAATVELTRAASALGVDGVMVVTPYYNRPSQRGLDGHFRAAAAATDLPVLLYNIPSRTACEIAPETLALLLMRAEKRRVRKNGVQCFQSHWFYYHEAMAEWKGSDVEVRYSDSDYSRVWVLLPDHQLCEADHPDLHSQAG